MKARARERFNGVDGVCMYEYLRVPCVRHKGYRLAKVVFLRRYLLIGNFEGFGVQPKKIVSQLVSVSRISWDLNRLA